MNFKKRTNFLFGALLLTGSLLAQNVCVSTPKTSLLKILFPLSMIDIDCNLSFHNNTL